MAGEIRKGVKIIKIQTHGTETQASEGWALLSRSSCHSGNRDGAGSASVEKIAATAVTGQNCHCRGEEPLLR